MNIRSMALCLCLALPPSCMAWQQKAETALVYAHEAGITARKVASPAIDEICVKRANKCKDNKDTVCEPWRKCNRARKLIAKILIQIQFTTLNGKIAIAVSNRDSAIETVMEANQLVGSLRKQLQELGVIK